MIEIEFACFGTADMSDACAQCSSNSECAKETIRRMEVNEVRVKIFCHCCEGKGTISEKTYPSGKEIQSVCPECNGEKWVWSEKAGVKVKQS